MADIKCAKCGEPWDGGSVRDDARHGTGGSMDAWQARLFLAGAGCPCCEGAPRLTTRNSVAERGAVRLEAFARGLMFSGDFEGEQDEAALRMLEDGPRALPEWKRPDPVVLETCAGCGVRVVVSPDDGKTLEWDGGEAVHFAYGHAYTYGDLRAAETLPDLEDWPWERRVIMRTAARRGAKFGDDATATDDDPPDDVAGPRRTFCPGCVETCRGDGCLRFDGPSARIFARADLEAGDTYATGSSFPDPRDPYHGGAICVDCLEEIPTCSECSEPLGDDGGEADDEGRCDSCADEWDKENLYQCEDCGERRVPASNVPPDRRLAVVGGAAPTRRGPPLILDPAGRCGACAAVAREEDAWAAPGYGRTFLRDVWRTAENWPADGPQPVRDVPGQLTLAF